MENGDMSTLLFDSDDIAARREKRSNANEEMSIEEHDTAVAMSTNSFILEEVFLVSIMQGLVEVEVEVEAVLDFLNWNVSWGVCEYLYGSETDDDLL